MRFEMIGPLRVTGDDGVELRLPRGRVRQLLAVLLLNEHPVPEDRLREWLADGGRSMAGSTLRTHITALRRALGSAEGRLRTESAGYRIEAEPGEVDLKLFRQLSRQGMAAHADGDPATAARLLGQAAELWKEPALVDVSKSPHLWPQVTEVSEEWRLVTETLIDVRLSLGEHRELIPELRARAASDPPQERLYEQLMTALCRSGRRAEACDAYLRLRSRLAESYGVEPGTAVETLHRRILKGDQVLSQVPGAIGTTTRT